LLLAPVAAHAAVTLDQALAERSQGNPAAPVTLIEYSSLSCPHCADFHRETLGKIREAFIETGKVRYIFRDFPLEPRAMAASMTARCVDPSRYFGFLDLLYGDQAGWAKSKDPLRELQIRAQLAGLSEADFKACLDNRDLFQGLQKIAEEGRKAHDIQSTPTFLINGTKISGALPFAEFEKAINQALAKKS
jgi:protein-disulfide isomerase